MLATVSEAAASSLNDLIHISCGRQRRKGVMAVEGNLHIKTVANYF